MMNYEMFKGIVESEFKSFLTDEYKDMEVRIGKTNKVNRNLDSITLVPPKKDGASKTISPAIYVNDMYDHYKKCEDLQLVLKQAAEKMMIAIKQGKDMLPLVENLMEAKDKIVFQLINAVQNEEMLKNVPHREFQDLAIVYRIVVKMDPSDGMATAMITNDLAKAMGLTEEELFKLAAENTKTLLPVKIQSMSEVLRGIFAKDGMPDEVIDSMMPDEMSDDMQMYVITNAYNVNGAGSMLYEKELGELADKVGSDLYILPSSIHEVIAIPDMGRDPKELADMVQQINMSQVDLAERLSNQVYKYDRRERKLSLATDTPHKRLDGMNIAVAEPKMIYDADKPKDNPKR